MRKTGTLLDHDRIVTALNEIGDVVERVLQRSVTIRIYGGAALILASNFRETTDDIDYVANKIRPLPQWIKDTAKDDPENDFLLAASAAVTKKHKYPLGWFNYQVLPSLSHKFDHHEFSHHEGIGAFPAKGTGLDVYVPALDYILAMKLQALRINKKDKYKDLKDLLCLMRIKGDEIKTPDDLIKIHARFFMPYQRHTDFEAGIEQLWQHHTTGKVPVVVRRSGIPATPRYLGRCCA